MLHAEIRASDFFVLRTPTWPFDAFERWGADLETPACADDDPRLDAALEADRRVLRARLRTALETPELRGALRVAAPDLDAQLADDLQRPPDAPPSRAELALVRYLTRMATRPTPFGLFAGSALGTLGELTRLALGPRERARLKSRLDMGHLEAITRSLGADPALRTRLLHRPNETLYRAAGRLRYVEVRWEGPRRAHRLVAAEPSPHLDATLARAQRGATIDDLAAPLADENGVSREEAIAFVTQLVDRQILVSEWAPPLTSTDPLAELGDTLSARGADPALRAQLERLRDGMQGVDARGIAADPALHLEIAAEISRLPLNRHLPCLVQVDLVRDAPEATLGASVVEELARAVDLLHRLSSVDSTADLDRFREAFLERYETQEVPLLEALDPEIGLGFGPIDARAEAGPWLDGWSAPRIEPDRARTRAARLHALVAGAAVARGPARIELDRADVESLAAGDRAPLPDAFAALAVVAATSDRAIANGDFQILVEFVLGPSGARLLGRFCHADPALRAAVERHLRDEEALRPDVVFAEIVHLPEGRLGNVLCRPSLRPHEIPFLGRSGAPEERQIPLADLRVTIVEGRIVLRSARHGREVVPRLTSAHNYRLRTLPLYRFLATLQSQGRSERAIWDWGPLESAPHLPRVTHGRIVLARERWRVLADELRPLLHAEGAARVRAMRAWRSRRALPRHVVLADGDHRLLVDLENPWSLESFLQLAKSRPELILVELFPAPDALPARGPDGRYTHEILVPFVRTRALDEVRAADSSPPPRGADAGSSRTAPMPRRLLPPGSECLFARLATGVATVDRVLVHVVGPLIRGLEAERPELAWFFLRYADPSWHLRLRIFGAPEWLRAVVAPALEDAVAPLLEERTVWRLTYDTYQREIERYGGAWGILASEQLFACDSRCALDWIANHPGEDGLDARGLLALLGTDRTLQDFGWNERLRRVWFGEARDALVRRLRLDRDGEHRLAASFRTRRSRLEPAIEGRAEDERSRQAERALERRSAAARPIAGAIAQRAAEGRLEAPLASIVASHVHLQCNRLLRSAHAEQELVIYDALCRLYDARAARRRAGVGGVTRAADGRGEGNR